MNIPGLLLDVVAIKRPVAVTDTDEELVHSGVELAAEGVDVIVVKWSVLARERTPK